MCDTHQYVGGILSKHQNIKVGQFQTIGKSKSQNEN